jgi:hypothetical protein
MCAAVCFQKLVCDRLHASSIGNVDVRGRAQRHVRLYYSIKKNHVSVPQFKFLSLAYDGAACDYSSAHIRPPAQDVKAPSGAERERVAMFLNELNSRSVPRARMHDLNRQSARRSDHGAWIMSVEGEIMCVRFL